MAGESFDYSDYHRTVLGFHGTTKEAAKKLVDGKPFQDSDEDDEWFGKGVYFWEYAPKQAWWWAKTHKKYPQPAVVGAVIRLGNCFDLLDPVNVATLKSLKEEMVSDLKLAGNRVPKNVLSHKRLDCAVFNYLYGRAESVQQPIDTARAVFAPSTTSTRAWKTSWINDNAHIQICVRTQSSILAVWHVREDGRYGKEDEGQEGG